MKDLEQAIADGPINDGVCRHAYSRTGNGLKELVYYTSDRERFMAAFNTALSDHPQFPLEIVFNDDPKWDDFRELLDAFRKSENR